MFGNENEKPTISGTKRSYMTDKLIGSTLESIEDFGRVDFWFGSRETITLSTGKFLVKL